PSKKARTRQLQLLSTTGTCDDVRLEPWWLTPWRLDLERRRVESVTGNERFASATHLGQRRRTAHHGKNHLEPLTLQTRTTTVEHRRGDQRAQRSALMHDRRRLERGEEAGAVAEVRLRLLRQLEVRNQRRPIRMHTSIL